MGRSKHRLWSGALVVALAIAASQTGERPRDPPAGDATSRFERGGPAMVRGGPAQRRGKRRYTSQQHFDQSGYVSRARDAVV